MLKEPVTVTPSPMKMLPFWSLVSFISTRVDAGKRPSRGTYLPRWNG